MRNWINYNGKCGLYYSNPSPNRKIYIKPRFFWALRAQSFSNVIRIHNAFPLALRALGSRLYTKCSKLIYFIKITQVESYHQFSFRLCIRINNFRYGLWQSCCKYCCRWDRGSYHLPRAGPRSRRYSLWSQQPRNHDRRWLRNLFGSSFCGNKVCGFQKSLGF